MAKVFVAVLLVVSAHRAEACSVIVVDTLKATFQGADAVFLGRVTDFRNYRATFEVIESFKGPDVRQFDLSAVSNCDFDDFAVTRTYLVLAHHDGEVFRASLGSYTTEVTPETEARVHLVRRRAAWWRSSASRFAPIRALTFMWRSLLYAISRVAVAHFG